MTIVDGGSLSSLPIGASLGSVVPANKVPRARRSPERSRALILEAATEVLAELGPDAAGLKDVAGRAGVSHSLVTHYFGTFAALVEEVLAARMEELREVVLAWIADSGAQTDIEGLIQLVFARVRDPVTSRLMAWAFLSGRMDEAGFFAYERMGLRAIVDAAAERAGDIDRAELERRVMLVWCALMTYGVAGPLLWRVLGHEPTAERDAEFEAMLTRVATAGVGSL